MSFLSDVPELVKGKYLYHKHVKLLIRRNNRQNNPLRANRGDVIGVFPPDHEFSQKELDNPNWLIVDAYSVREDLEVEVQKPKTELVTIDAPDGTSDETSQVVRYRGTNFVIDDVDDDSVTDKAPMVSIDKQKIRNNARRV